MSSTSVNERKSGIELFKVIAIFLIVLYHAIQTFWGLEVEYNSQIVVIYLMRTIGQLGNIIFIVCSSWFLIEEKRENFKPQKYIKLLLSSTLISIIIFLLLKLVFRIEINTNSYVVQFFPDLYENNWFIPCYVIFCCLCHFLSDSIRKLNKKEHLAWCIIIYIVYGIIDMFVSIPQCNGLMSFIAIFMTVSFFKYYMSEFNKDIKKNIFIAIIIFVFYELIYLFDAEETANITKLYNPFMLPMVICLFNVFNSLEFKSKVINKLSSYSLFIYCIHENILLRTKIRPKYYYFFLKTFKGQYLLAIFTCAVGMIIMSLIFSAIFSKLFSKIIDKTAAKIEEDFNILVEKISQKIS